MKYILLVLTFMVNAAQCNLAFATPQLDYVNLGATLLKDGYTQRAKDVLEKANVQKLNFDFARYYTLKGILLNKLAYPELSNIFFKASVKHGQKNPSILLYMARNYWQLQNYPEVISALNKAGDVAKKNSQMMVVKAQAYKLQGMHEKAWAVLDEGIKLFPGSNIFYRQKFYYLLELGLYKQASEYVQKHLLTKEHSVKDYLAFSYAFRENSQFDEAAALLEEAVLKYGSDEKLIELLSQVYIDKEKYLMAALVLDWASIEHPKFANKAAILYLKAKQPIRSMQLNRRILSQADKFKQRLGIDIFLEDYESLVTMAPALKRYNLLKQDNIAYALGYGYFKNGDYINAKKYLKKISDSQLFAKASTVFQQIEKCQSEPVECY